MTKPVLTDPRRTGLSSGLSFGSSAGDGLEMPVLFQLTDQTQFKVLTPQAAPKSERKTAPKDLSLALPEITPPATGVQQAATSESAPPDSGSPTSPAALTALAQTLLPVASRSTETAPVPDSPTIRERAQLRQRRQAATKMDWFQTQGKYIIVVFVVALAGTIYAARLRDDSPSPPATDLRTSDLAHAGTEPLPDSHAPALEQQPQLTAETDASPQASENPAAATATADAVAETNPPVSALTPETSADKPLADSGTAGESPQVNLQTPLANQADSPVAPSPDESLFPWATGPEERVASRPQPESPSSSVPMPRANPHYQRRSPTVGVASPGPQSPASRSPAAQSAPPGTAAEQPAAAMYPVTDPATYRNFQAEAPRLPASAGAAPATFENRVPTAPRTSGPRYERTGSGLY